MDETPWSERRLEIRRSARRPASRRAPRRGPSGSGAPSLRTRSADSWRVRASGLRRAQDREGLETAAPSTSTRSGCRSATSTTTASTRPTTSDGKWSVNFAHQPAGGGGQGDHVPRRGRGQLRAPRPGHPVQPATLKQYAGTYETPTGARFEVALGGRGRFGLVFSGQPFRELIPWKERRFRSREFSNVTSSSSRSWPGAGSRS